MRLKRVLVREFGRAIAKCFNRLLYSRNQHQQTTRSKVTKSFFRANVSKELDVLENNKMEYIYEILFIFPNVYIPINRHSNNVTKKDY